MEDILILILVLLEVINLIAHQLYWYSVKRDIKYLHNRFQSLDYRLFEEEMNR